jgi:hypothetical protein
MNPQWSLIGDYVVYKEQYSQRSGAIGIHLRLLPAGGSRNHVDLSAGLDRSINKVPISWVSDVVVP